MDLELAEHIYDLRVALDESAAVKAAQRSDAQSREAGKTILIAGRRAVAERDITAMIQRISASIAASRNYRAIR